MTATQSAHPHLLTPGTVLDNGATVALATVQGSEACILASCGGGWVTWEAQNTGWGWVTYWGHYFEADQPAAVVDYQVRVHAMTGRPGAGS